MLTLHNTLTKKQEQFVPLADKRVLMYQCGPTLYWVQHIGNLRSMVLADLIVRSLRYLGYSVTFVRNYTDVGHLTSDEDSGEDKMEKGVRREKKTPQEIASKYREIFEHDVQALHTLAPAQTPMATEYVTAMQEMVRTLLDKGFAYATDLAIYFDISKAADYTRLSGQKLDMNQAGAGSGDVSDPAKRHPQDFSLWFFKKGAHERALQTWDFPPYGPGFPGWHIECSAMIRQLLGPTIDIHMGGIEHIPVHHTNEIAQSEAANAAPFVRYWVHNEHLTVDGGKMSKSSGTSYSLADVTARGYAPLDLRYFFLQAQYRSRQNFTWEALDAARSGRAHLMRQYAELALVSDGEGTVDAGWNTKFVHALEDDVNIPQALALVSGLLRDKAVLPQDKLATLRAWDAVFGLRLGESDADETIPDDIMELLRRRDDARAQKRWQESDEIRDELAARGYMAEDTPHGTRVTKKPA